MIRLIMREGPNELEIMRILIRNDKLIFGEDDLIGLEPYHAKFDFVLYLTSCPFLLKYNLLKHILVKYNLAKR